MSLKAQGWTRTGVRVEQQKQAYRRIVARVALLTGGLERLAVTLGVPTGVVSQWIQGLAPVPPDMFLRCVDLLLDHELPTDPARPSQRDNPKIDPI
jgi:hypothetical protein